MRRSFIRSPSAPLLSAGEKAGLGAFALFAVLIHLALIGGVLWVLYALGAFLLA